MGPNNGGSFDYGKCGSPERSLGMGAGKQAGGRKRKTRRRGKKFKKGTKSKTHSGKDFETRKSSKRYGEKRWRKYLRGRKTMIAPDFPFAGGASYEKTTRQTPKPGLKKSIEKSRKGLASVGKPTSTTKKKKKGNYQCFGQGETAHQNVTGWLQGNADPQCMQGGYRYSQKRRQGRRNKSKRVYRGGYHVPGSNVPNAPSYSTGGSLPGGLSALANPVPYQRLDNCIPNDFPIRH